MDENKKVEILAEYAHDSWSGWMKYLFEKSHQKSDGTVVIPKWAVTRWKRQLKTKYSELPDEEKESDKNEAKEIIRRLDY